MSRICAGCGRQFCARGYNAHYSRQDAPEKCKGRHNERIANVTVSVIARKYRVSLQGGVEDELPLAEDSDGGAAGSPRASPEPSPSPGPGPGPRGNFHVIYM